jgi:hypothetical protein
MAKTYKKQKKSVKSRRRRVRHGGGRRRIDTMFGDTGFDKSLTSLYKKMFN